VHVFPVTRSGPEQPGRHSLSVGEKSEIGGPRQVLFKFGIEIFHQKSFVVKMLCNKQFPCTLWGFEGGRFPADSRPREAKISDFRGSKHLHKLFTQASPLGAACGARIEIRGALAQEKMAFLGQENLHEKGQIFLTLPEVKMPPRFPRRRHREKYKSARKRTSRCSQ
jgi:hypothetical protein